MSAKSFKVWVTGGYFDDSGECFVYEVDLLQNKKTKIISLIPPDNLSVPRKGFTGATWCGIPGKSDLLVCGFCALFRFSPPKWQLTGVLHQPCMNDLHHVAVHEQNILLVNTGLDTIDVFHKSGRFIGSHSLQPSWINKERQNGVAPSVDQWESLQEVGWQSRILAIDNSPTVEDYYQSNSTNFHQRPIRDFIHLNNVTTSFGQILATSLSNHCVYNICNFSKIIQNIPSPPHDGLIYNENFWITCVDGTILAYKIENGTITDNITYSMNVFEHTIHHGWCRGIMLCGDYLAIGITEIRRKPQYDWIVSPWETTKTGVICWDLSEDKIFSFVNLSEERHSKIFSIIAAGS